MIEVFNTGKAIPDFPKIVLPKELEAQLLRVLADIPKEYDVVQIQMIKRKTKRRPQMQILALTCKINPKFMQKPNRSKKMKVGKATFFNHE